MVWSVVWCFDDNYLISDAGIEGIFSTKEKAFNYCKESLNADYMEEEAEGKFYWYTIGSSVFYIVEEVSIEE